MEEKILIIVLLVLLLVALFMLRRMKNAALMSMKAERMMKTFLLNIDHEIRVPLKVFETMADTMARDDLYLSKNEKRNISEQIKYNAELIGTLMDEVMMFSDAGQIPRQLCIESFSPNAMCRRCLEANQLSIYHRSAVKLTFSRELADEFFFTSDRHLVELIVNKLIINSCKFTEEGEITLGCNITDYTDCITFTITDTGVGIPEHRIGSLFSYFEHPDDVKDEAEVDLSICMRLAEKLGGRMVLDRGHGPGTRLQLILPLR